MNDMSRTSRVVTVTDQMGAGIWSVCKVAKKPESLLGHFFFKQSLFRLQGDQDHFFTKEMLISPSILKLHKNP